MSLLGDSHKEDKFTTIVDGYRVAVKDDMHMELSNRVMYRLVRDSQPGAWLVDLIPISEVYSFVLILSFTNPIG